MSDAVVPQQPRAPLPDRRDLIGGLLGINGDGDSSSSAGSQTASATASPDGGLFGSIINGITSAVNPILSVGPSLTSAPSSTPAVTSTSLSATSTSTAVASTSSSSPPSSAPSSSSSLLSSAPSSSSPTSTTPSSTVAPSSVPPSTPTASPTASPVSSASDVYVSGTGVDAVTIHTTLASQSQETAKAKPVSFLDNKPLSAGVFSLVGVVALILLITIATLALRKRRRNRLLDDAVDFAPSTHLTAPEDDEKAYPDLHRTRSNRSSNGSHTSPSPFGGRISPERMYANGAGYGGTPQLPGQSYGNGVYAYYDNAVPPSQQMYNSAPKGPLPYPGQAYNPYGGVPNPNQGYNPANPAVTQVSRLNTVTAPQASRSQFAPERQHRGGLPYTGNDTSPSSSISYNAYNYNGYDVDQPVAADPRVQVGRKVSLTKATATTVVPLRKGSTQTQQYDPTQPQMAPSPVLPPTFGHSASSDGHGGSLQVRNG